MQLKIFKQEEINDIYVYEIMDVDVFFVVNEFL